MTGSAVAALLVAMPVTASALDVSSIIEQITNEIQSLFQSDDDSGGAIAQSQTTGPLANAGAPQVATNAAVTPPVTAPAVANAVPIDTDGDAVVSDASVNASSRFSQTFKQSISAEQ
jgi:hypothetical protein